MNRVRISALLLTLTAVAVLTGSLFVGLGAHEPAASASAAPDARRERLRVEVLNAAGVPGLARVATQHLRDLGFDVVYYGNASGASPDSSRVLDRMGRLQGAHDVARAVGIEAISLAPDTTLYVDVTVILGRDWEGRP